MIEPEILKHLWTIIGTVISECDRRHKNIIPAIAEGCQTRHPSDDVLCMNASLTSQQLWYDGCPSKNDSP
uniref:Uncharacterized protein n=1 Tax=Romanomermis culicivorax TaxID=13658 RepID=A0A915HR23_ROMCU